MAMRATLPLLEIARQVCTGFRIPNAHLTKFKTVVHEDNQGCQKLANLEPGRQTPRSKFYAIKMHWFRSWLKPRDIEIEYINTVNQKADILTKSLSFASFEANRKLSHGW
jgi:hypothetical protein